MRSLTRTLLVACSLTAAIWTARTDAQRPADDSGSRAAVVTLPYATGANAIWGATGQDGRGHVWFGVSTGGVSPNSAHLIEYVPASRQAIDRGNVMAELARAGLARPGEQQAKIHSKIVAGAGNNLYFASMDEDGEKSDGSKLPTWGGHLWRLNIATNRWQHLLRAPEALIAVGAGGRFVYALGYFGHVLYQYDTQTGKTARVQVGSVEGHISRNLVVDDRGHAYVPRLTSETPAAGPRQVRVSLVELGTDLREVRATPIDAAHYLGGNGPTDAHGIIGLQTMADRSIAFTTHTGRLFRVIPPQAAAARGAGPAEIVNAGWIHPDGPSYPASLFTSDGRTSLATLARRSNNPGPWMWVTCAWPALECLATSITVSGLDAAGFDRALLYGSATRDADGGHYVAGMGPGYRPLVVRIQGR